MSRSDRGGRDAVAEGDWGRIQIATPSRLTQYRRGGACPSRTGRVIAPSRAGTEAGPYGGALDEAGRWDGFSLHRLRRSPSL